MNKEIIRKKYSAKKNVKKTDDGNKKNYPAEIMNTSNLLWREEQKMLRECLGSTCPHQIQSYILSDRFPGPNKTEYKRVHINRI